MMIQSRETSNRPATCPEREGKKKEKKGRENGPNSPARKRACELDYFGFDL